MDRSKDVEKIVRRARLVERLGTVLLVNGCVLVLIGYVFLLNMCASKLAQYLGLRYPGLEIIGMSLGSVLIGTSVVIRACLLNPTGSGSSSSLQAVATSVSTKTVIEVNDEISELTAGNGTTELPYSLKPRRSVVLCCMAISVVLIVVGLVFAYMGRPEVLDTFLVLYFLSVMVLLAVPRFWSVP